MTGLRDRFLRIGIEAGDDEETRLRKLLLLLTASIVGGLAVLWGGLYWAFDEPLAAAIPWLYTVLSLVSIVLFARRRSYRWFVSSQLALAILLPFGLMAVLGGFIAGSGVALWALFSPVLALILIGRRQAVPWLAIFLALMAVSAMASLDGGQAPRLPNWLLATFFALNLGGVSAVAFVLFSTLTVRRETTIGAMRGLVHYLSPSVAAELMSHPERVELGGELAEVTVLFADLRGFTSYADSHSPAEAVWLLNRYFALAIPKLIAQDGTPIALAGDQVMAIFNAPQPHADHALRAARAALDIQAAIAEIGTEFESSPPQFGIGINTGPALLGNIGSAEFRNFTAIGDTTNTAARLQAIAPAGGIVVGPVTARMLSSLASLAPLGAVTVKGKPEPIEVCSLLAIDGGPPTSAPYSPTEGQRQ
jgi:class 3 adenylate cyclase